MVVTQPKYGAEQYTNQPEHQAEDYTMGGNWLVAPLPEMSKRPKAPGGLWLSAGWNLEQSRRVVFAG
jgi:hypothetical protein